MTSSTFILSKRILNGVCHRKFSSASTYINRRPGWRRRRFYRRITVFSIGFAAWFFTIDADVITYSLDFYHRNLHKTPFKELNGLIPNKQNDFGHKTIWIVGASSGIGEHIALNLCSIKQDAPKRIIISARRKNELIR